MPLHRAHEPYNYETSNTVVLVVSEETGDISVAEKGNIKKYDDIKKLRNKIEKLMSK